ncbi:MAG: isoaspartyl peptidase/L-asparaginase [Anaerolineae bacterium]|nr:isoaspartyl peptidase/L-asparaginase [Anaerolineae bacterium]
MVCALSKRLACFFLVSRWRVVIITACRFIRQGFAVHRKECPLRRPVLVIHGGAGFFPEAQHEACVAGCREAALAGWERLLSGASALDAVEAAVRVLEDDAHFDAGRGSFFNRESVVQMDAIVMEGRTLNLGAVAAVERIRHPVTLARWVMERSPHNVIVGPGAMAFAESQGMPLCDPSELLGTYAPGDPRAQRPSDTVGAVALDVHGDVAVATSTGGMSNKWPGRVGDSPLVGSGAYADNLSGAASATGDGEKLMRIVISKTACDHLQTGRDPQETAEEVLRLLAARTGGRGGVILVDHRGQVGLAHTTPHMPYAYLMPDQEIVSGMEVLHDATVLP